MSKKWSSYDKEKAYTDAWRTFLEENQITEEELDEGKYEDFTKWFKTKSDAAADKLDPARAGLKAAAAAPKLAKGIPSGKPQPKAEPVAKRGPNIASIKVGLSTLATKTGQGTAQKAAKLRGHEAQAVYDILNTWSRKNLKTSMHGKNLKTYMQEAAAPFGGVAPTAQTPMRPTPSRGPVPGAEPAEVSALATPLDLSKFDIFHDVNPDVAANKYRLVSAEIARVLEPLGVELIGAEEAPQQKKIDTAQKLSLFLRSDRAFHQLLRQFSAPDAEVFHKFLTAAADMLDEPGNQPRGQALTYWQNLMRTMQAFNQEYQTSKEKAAGAEDYGKTRPRAPDYQPATIGEAQMKKLENEILKEVQRVLHEKKRS